MAVSASALVGLESCVSSSATGMEAAAAKSVASERLTERTGSMLCCVKLPNCGFLPLSGLSVTSTTESAEAFHLFAANTANCSSVRPLAHF